MVGFDLVANFKMRHVAILPAWARNSNRPDPTQPIRGKSAMPALIETMLVEQGRVRLIDRHLARLRRSGAATERITEAQRVIERACERDDHVLRIDVADEGIVEVQRAMKPATPVRLRTAIGYDPTDAKREHKLIDREWTVPFDAMVERSDDHDETLLVSQLGLVGETTRANIFAIVNGHLVTPEPHGLLLGVTRSWVIDIFGALQQPLTTRDLADAEALFLTTSGRGIVPVVAINARKYNAHELTATIANQWRALP